MKRETVDCPFCGDSTTVSLDETKQVEGTTASRTAVGILPKANLQSATCSEGHRFYVKYSVSG